MTLTTDQIARTCERGFGLNRHIESTQELGGGTFNTTYLITFTDQLKAILRVSPPQTVDILWDEALLMRREHSMQPFFAPVAALMPKTLFTAFIWAVQHQDQETASRANGALGHVAELLPTLLWDSAGSTTTSRVLRDHIRFAFFRKGDV